MAKYKFSWEEWSKSDYHSSKTDRTLVVELPDDDVAADFGMFLEASTVRKSSSNGYDFDLVVYSETD